MKRFAIVLVAALASIVGAGATDDPPTAPAPPDAAATSPPAPVPVPVPVTGHGPIGCLVLSDTGHRSADNPRGWSPYWLHKNGLKTSDPAYHERFRANLMAEQKWVLNFCTRAGIKRVIVWDIEGQELDHWESYVGDPRILPPEMAYKSKNPKDPWEYNTAQLFFKGFSDAGISVGGTIRPTILRTVPYGTNRLRSQQDTSYGWEQAFTADPQAVVSGKLGFAVFRMGWKEVYFDSSVNEWAWIKPGNPEPFGIDFYKPLLERYPKVCLHPEYGPRDGMLPNVQPYSEWRKGAPLPTGAGSIGISPFKVDASDPEVQEQLKLAASKGIDFMVAADQPLAVENVLKQCQLWREGAGVAGD